MSAMLSTIKVLFLASEAEPFVKVGGLADVAGSLPRALRSLSPESTRRVNLDVRLALPLHESIRSQSLNFLPVAGYNLPKRRGSTAVQIFQVERAELPVYFISGRSILKAETVYSADPAEDREKYAFFSLAALEMLQHLDWQPDVIHANDWHTALTLYALRSHKKKSVYKHIKAVLTLHNLPFTGGDGKDVLKAYGIKPAADRSLPEWARSSLLPLGLWAADSIVAVSPTYAREILTPQFGCGLEGFLRSREDSLCGILNGLDVVSFDPQHDPALAAQFDSASLEARAVNKRALQQQLDLPVEQSVPVLCMVGRIDVQKGFDLAMEALRRMAPRPWQAVLLGSGDPGLESAARQLASDFPDRVRAVIRYDASLARLIYGGADIFLMPSRYEPCGLAQMIAMRYGCVPVVRATGGLKDTVRNGRTGFHIHRSTAGSVVAALERVLDIFKDVQTWRSIQRTAMEQDFSWRRSARRYASLYRSLMA